MGEGKKEHLIRLLHENLSSLATVICNWNLTSVLCLSMSRHGKSVSSRNATGLKFESHTVNNH